jgi:hypothetical protein
VIVVAVDGGEVAFLDQRADLVGMRAVADEVAAAVDPLDAELVDAAQRGEVAWMSVVTAAWSIGAHFVVMMMKP